MSDAPPQVTSINEVRARLAHPHLIQLPESGLTVQIRKVALLELAARGGIPDDLTNDALTDLAEALEEAQKKSPEVARRTMQRRIDLIDAVACALLVEPRMEKGGGDDTLSPDELPLADRAHLYGIAAGTVEGPNLSPFPSGPGADVAPVEDGEGVRDQAIDAPGGP